MAIRIVAKEDMEVLNYCAKYLTRDSTDPRHNFGPYDPQEFRARICESWRFPLIEGYSDNNDFLASSAFNEVTFVFADASQPLPPQRVLIIGTFANLFEPIPLRRLKFTEEETPFWSLTVVVPKGQTHTYKFLVDERPMLDPINPQQAMLENGQRWSRFFTESCSHPISFERWEMALLERLTSHILPFRTEEGQRALQRGLVEKTFLLDQSVGAVNFIDKLVAREENHYLDDYKTCLELIDRLLRQRNPFVEPQSMPKEMFVQLYNELASNNVPGWDYGRYNSPRFFLQLLRRHTYTGAFCHPKYGGNTQAAGWAYLEEKFRDPATKQTLFDWRRVIEKPLGNDPEYHG